ncbi:dienelactone hydrolase family protein [Aestuariimicrobium sp. T2.26MG-19.2B]|uniref:dienelactone hydrolase family protein n=1 Tax=Aestuariimicrobium sp. T2.26MG-19.2B TaxID=3040679 RepID=UPI0024775770|nr:dienelactone hydrolase family protein [Aestuariimicrobium sp. T2.26MG-19.2B]CAI9410041.1 Carboxymethylenebutenolidase [Aestuariimicrobium sp. T2.26MG-19.2B]
MPEATVPIELVESPEGSGAAIVLVHEIFGRSQYMRTRARDLAALGYTVALPQLYWRIGADAVDENGDDSLERGVALMQQVDWQQAVDDVRLVIASLRREPRTGGRVALVGFCFGGGLAYAALQGAADGERADALVSYYGSALPNLVDGEAVTVPSLHHFGDADAYLTTDAVENICEVVQHNGAEVKLWQGAGHAFDNPAPQFHHAQASDAAWEATVEWLRTHYPA